MLFSIGSSSIYPPVNRQDNENEEAAAVQQKINK